MLSPLPKWASITAIISMIALLIIGILLVSSSMIPALVWGAILAIALRPIQKRINLSEGKSAIIIVGVLSLVSVGTLSLMSWNIGSEMTDISHHVMTDTVRVPSLNVLPQFIQNNTHVKEFLATHTHVDKGTLYFSMPHIGNNIKEYVDRYSSHVMTGVHFLTETLETLSFTFLSLFCYLASYKRITRQILKASNALIGREDIVFHIVHSIRGTVSGLVLVGIVEGLIISPAFVFCGTPHPAIFTAIISIAAMIPFVGPPVAILAGLLTYTTVGLTPAIIVSAVSLTILFSGDHFVRPIFIGGATKLPFLATLIGILGGMHALGFIGLFIGPSIMATGHMLWSELVNEPEDKQEDHKE